MEPTTAAPDRTSATTMAEAFRQTVERVPDRVAVRTVDDSVSLTFAQLRDRVDAVAGGLAELGVSRGDTVALMFIGGDINFPVVLGGVWNKTDKTPEDNANGKNDFRGYRSRAGSRVVLDDSSNGKVMLADKTNKNVVAVGKFAKGGDGDNASDIPRPSDAGSGGVLVAAMDGKLNITCKNGKLTATGTQIKVQAQNAVEMKSGADLIFDGGMTQVVASGNANFDGSNTKIGP